MRVLWRAFTLGLLLITTHVSVVSADPILITDRRRVTAGGNIGSNVPPTVVQTPAPPFAPFVGLATLSVAQGEARAETVSTQRSSLAPRVFSASGTVDSSAMGSAAILDAASTVGSSLFDLEFDLPTAHRFSLTGVMGVTRLDDPGSDGFGEVDLLLTSLLASGEQIIVSDGLRSGSRTFDFTGILVKGRHRFFAEAFTESNSFGPLTRHTPTYDLEFSLTPVPEPASLLLVGGGFAALMRRRVRAR